MPDNKVTLPGRDVIISRLSSVDNEAHIVEYFYPLLAEREGRQYISEGLVTLYDLCVAEYIRSANLDPITAGFITGELQENFPFYLDSLELDDLDVVKDAKVKHQQKWGYQAQTN